MQTLSLLQQFTCLGSACADNCCNSWAVKIDPPTLTKWQCEAPDLLSLATEREGIGKVIAMTGEKGCCPKLEQGICTIHRDHGEAFLTDPCALYPRITRALGATTLQTATLSCPEIARLALFEETPFAWVETPSGRMPSSLKHYLPAGMEETSALEYARAIVEVAGRDALSSSSILSHMLAFAHAHNTAPLHKWPTLLAPALPTPQPHPHDALFLLILLTTLVQTAGITPSERLSQLVRIIERVLHVQVQWKAATVDIAADTPSQIKALEHVWQTECAEYLDPLLKRIIQAQYSSTLYPFAGLGETPFEKAVWIAVTFAAMRLSLMCVCKAVGGLPTEEEAIHAIQPLARVFDHVGNMSLVKPMLQETGWLELPRALGLVTYASS